MCLVIFQCNYRKYKKQEYFNSFVIISVKLYFQNLRADSHFQSTSTILVCYFRRSNSNVGGKLKLRWIDNVSNYAKVFGLKDGRVIASDRDS